jgi:NAD(P)-dependent dehydrogenase (short-subunit alcohol dehydrogenase family)
MIHHECFRGGFAFPDHCRRERDCHTMAPTFRDASAKVFVCDMNTAVLTQLQAGYPDIGVTATDVAAPDQVDAMFQAVVSELGGIAQRRICSVN